MGTKWLLWFILTQQHPKLGGTLPLLSLFFKKEGKPPESSQEIFHWPELCWCIRAPGVEGML